jgi:putative tricarboxylic transport membrane protein
MPYSLILIVSILVLGLNVNITTAAGQDHYFADKTITYIVGSEAGGGYDRYARLIAPFLEKHLPGSRVVVVNRPAGAGVVALNEVASAKPDGLTIMTFNSGLLLSQIAKMDGINFDLSQLDWIGKAGAEARILLVHDKAGIESFNRWNNKGPPKIFVTSGFGSSSYIQSKLVRDAFGLNVRVLPGFGGNEAEAALMKGEVDGTLTSESNAPAVIDTGRVRAIVRFGEPSIEQFRSVPEAKSLAVTDDQKLVASKIAVMNRLGRLTLTSPNTSQSVLASLRKAYRDAVNDPELLAEASRQNMPIDFLEGSEVEKLVSGFLQQDENFMRLVEKSLIEN